MPLHFEDLDVISELAGLGSALIVPCNMCPAVTVAVRENQPFLRLFGGLLRSAPFERYLRELQARLGRNGVTTRVFRSTPYHQWFLCMWTRRKREKLKESARGYDAVIVLGCASATETVCDVVGRAGATVIEGMELTGIMNARLRIRWPGTLCLESCEVVPPTRGEPDRKSPAEARGGRGTERSHGMRTQTGEGRCVAADPVPRADI